MEVHEWLIDIPRDWSKQRCEYCHYSGPVKCMIKFGFNDVPRLLIGFYHPACAKKMLAENRKVCPVCGNTFFTHQRGAYDELCHDCSKDKKYSREWDRVVKQVLRATNRGLPASLTLKEWLDTLNDFHWSCAYCGGEYAVLDHFIAISKGGGTTKGNCVPACVFCNASKKDRDPFMTRLQHTHEIALWLREKG
jgi:uncharacterized Zn-finger protein